MAGRLIQDLTVLYSAMVADRVMIRDDAVAAVAQWRRVKLPYEAAECQIQIGETYQAEGNTHAASLEFQAARLTLTELGATGEVERVDALLAAD